MNLIKIDSRGYNREVVIDIDKVIAVEKYLIPDDQDAHRFYTISIVFNTGYNMEFKNLSADKADDLYNKIVKAANGIGIEGLNVLKI